MGRQNVNTKSLDKEVKNSIFFKEKSVDEIIARIEEHNNNYAIKLQIDSKKDYTKAIELGGFVLQYREPKARWVKTLF